MSPFFVFAVTSLLLSPDSSDSASPDPVLAVEFRWVEPRFEEGVTEKQSRSISPCDKGSWYLHSKPALTAKDFADVYVKSSVVAGGGMWRRQYSVGYKLKESAIHKLAQQCGDETRKRIVAVCVEYQGEYAKILPSPIKYFPATTFDRGKPKEFHPPIIGFMTKERASQIAQASR